jgi:hypothetical protein
LDVIWIAALADNGRELRSGDILGQPPAKFHDSSSGFRYSPFLIFKAFIRVARVVTFAPSNSAAPPGP